MVQIEIKAIYFDLDGTLADLYAVEDWLEMLRAYDETPYMKAETMVNMSLLARYIHRLQNSGIKVGVISALSKEPEPNFDKRVIAAKEKWLAKHLPSVTFDSLDFVPYTAVKNDVVANSECAVLFDDECRHREAWNGFAYEPSEIFEILKLLAL